MRIGVIVACLKADRKKPEEREKLIIWWREGIGAGDMAFRNWEEMASCGQVEGLEKHSSMLNSVNVTGKEARLEGRGGGRMGGR